ncbi:ATP-binding cassette domain-containing protein [Senegalia massiliensis]|uniref:ATP-binding cassette domain-containing protein n=1 Tax=Senegalia massiliensis TaxID=1720316 RepID=UPI0013639032
MAVVKFENVSKDYGNGKKALKNLNLEINEGEFVTLIGPSGCGKTTALKLINGLIKSSDGNIYINNKEISKWNQIYLRRQIGYVIQQVGLFPHLNISENISYVLKIKGVEKVQRKQRARELIELVGLTKNDLKKYPRELSGGQQQRVGVARALAADPPIILMDEPFGAIDEITRKKLQDELIDIHKKVNKTIIFVTHDIHEAMKLGNKIVLLKEGELIISGSREDIFFNQEDNYINEFFGIKSFTSYADVANIKNTLVKNYPTIELNNVENNAKLKFEEDINILPVLKNGQYIGMYYIGKNFVFMKENIENIAAINQNKTIMEALEIQFKEGYDILPVIDNENNYLGVFKINKAYNNMIKKAN